MARALEPKMTYAERVLRYHARRGAMDINSLRHDARYCISADVLPLLPRERRHIPMQVGRRKSRVPADALRFGGTEGDGQQGARAGQGTGSQAGRGKTSEAAERPVTSRGR